MEGPGGPIPFEDVEWVELSTQTVKGGRAGRPLSFEDMKEEILAALAEIQCDWELRQSTWSIDRLFENEPVEVIRILNPFRAGGEVEI